MNLALSIVGALFLLWLLGVLAAIIGESIANSQETRKVAWFCVFLAVVFALAMCSKR